MGTTALDDVTRAHMPQHNIAMLRVGIMPHPRIPVPSRTTTVQVPGVQDMTEKDRARGRDRKGDHGRREDRDRDRESVARRKAMKLKRKSEQHFWVAPLLDGPAMNLVTAMAW